MPLCDFCSSSNHVCFSSKYNGYLCRIHYMQMYHTGELKILRRSGSNEYVICGEYAEIVIYDKNRLEKLRAKIDIEDVEKCKQYRWSVSRNGYIVSKKKNTTVLLHRHILGLSDEDKEYIPDHINHDKTDNRKSNLRIATYSQNAMNASAPSSNTSSVKGVSWNGRDERWEAYISKDGVRHYLGYFKTLNEAKDARLKAESEFFGEYAYKGDTI